MQKNERMTDLGALRVFHRVSSSETLTQAAAQLGITQSAVSQTLKQLEQHFATELVVRRSRPIALTPAGLVLQQHSAKLLDANQQMLSAVQMASEGGLAQLRLGMIDSIADVVAQPLLAELEGQAAKFALRTGMLAPLHEALLAREIDLLITSDHMTQYPELAVQTLLRDPFVLIVEQQLAAPFAARVEQICQQLPNISFNRTLRLGSLTHLIGRRMGLDYQPHYELDSTASLLRFVAAGQGWAFVPVSCLLPHPEQLANLSILPIKPGSHARYVYLYHRRDELGSIPNSVVASCRKTYRQQLSSMLPVQAQWLHDENFEEV